jgi:hypothetical protein
MNRCNISHLILAVFYLTIASAPVSAQDTNYVAGALIQLNDNGAWSWFMDERVIVGDGKLVVGSIRSLGGFDGKKEDPNWGTLEVSVYDLATGTTGRTVLHQHFEQDDHDSPAFLRLPDKRILALYSKHGQERKIYSRFSEAGNPLTWGAATEFVTPGKDGPLFKADNVTYNNLFRLPSGRLYNFYRVIRLEPNYLVSDDNGQTWIRRPLSVR